MKKGILFSFFVLLAINLSGCVFGRAASTLAPTVQFTAAPTLMYVTIVETEGLLATPTSQAVIQPKQIAAGLIENPTPTPWSTHTPMPTATPTPIPLPPTATRTPVPTRQLVTPTATRTPIVSDPVTACPGAPAISNQAETWAQISLDPPVSNRVRLDPGLGGEIIEELKAGEVVWIQAGPRCADGLTWWYVRSLAGLEGWTAEGEAAAYWLIPPLHAFFYDTVSQRPAGRVVLDKGQKYRIILSGTYSLWIKQQWTDQGVCIRGDAEDLPMFPSPGKTNGPVGLDPFYWFARPFYGPCQPLTDPSETVSKIELSLDGGFTYSIPVPTVAEYRPDHTYTYEVTGLGQPLMVRLDDAPLEDNYGQILVIVEGIK